MRAEIKIGIAVGLVIAVVAVLYLVFAGPSTPGGAKPASTDQSTGADMPVTLVERAEPKRPVAPQEVLVPKIGSAETPTTPPIVEVRAPEPPKTPAPAPTAIVPAMAPAPSAATKPASAVLPVKVGPAPAVSSSSIEPAAPPAPAATAPEGTYIVKKGDGGFWSIAEKVYGQGKYWTLISKANPNVDSNNLTVGQKLVIPPAPTAPLAQHVAAAPPADTPVAQTTTGVEGKVHVVQQGDSWWSIAVKEYGNGRYWNEIKKANPHVEGSSLKIGMKLNIPPVDKSAKPAPPVTTAPVERPKAKPAAEESGDVRPVFD